MRGHISIPGLAHTGRLEDDSEWKVRYDTSQACTFRLVCWILFLFFLPFLYVTVYYNLNSPVLSSFVFVLIKTYLQVPVPFLPIFDSWSPFWTGTDPYPMKYHQIPGPDNHGQATTHICRSCVQTKRGKTNCFLKQRVPIQDRMDFLNPEYIRTCWLRTVYFFRTGSCLL